MVQGGTYRHVALGAETSGRSWRVAGVCNVQADGTLIQERGWVVIVTERCGNNKLLLMGGR